ncbi:17,18-epoxy-17-hydroxycur-19-ene N-malonyltransferase-like [Bidens hawaiensis]|uniref:17,18-epoxy-17-hydroxycur-19-ene N-malonyltransferase-like n=1 Tax=Bidens hawaiensis TaxID=980011 RepID=UPI00404AD451
MTKAVARTIISQEMVKPSSPTPSHLRTYNLSEIDQRMGHLYMPLILYYPDNDICSLTPDDKVRVMKKSLSWSLTRYHPFAGIIHTPTSSHIDCNDEGVVFVEAKHESQMNLLQVISDEDDNVAQLFVDGMFWENSPKGVTILGVQVNHFVCGGMAVAVSLSHQIGDGCTLGSFVSHWASVARYGSTDHKEVLPLNPHFVQHPAITIVQPEIPALQPRGPNVVTRRFLFPNSKLSDLKNKVFALAGGESINNPTQVEVLTSLLYKTAVATTTPSSSSSFRPYTLLFPANIRSKFVPKLPKTAVGNFVAGLFIKTQDESETSLSVLVSNLKKQKIELDRLQNMQLLRKKN